MRIMITDNDGTVFASHTIDRDAAYYILGELSTIIGVPVLSKEEWREIEQLQGSEFIDDLVIACQNEIREPGWTA